MVGPKSNKTKFVHGSRLRFPLHFPLLKAGLTGILRILAVLIFVLFNSAQASPQAAGFLSVDPVVRTVQHRYKLTKKEVARILPLVKQENIRVLRIYNRFGGENLEYSATLWQVVITSRIDFEERIGNKLNARQKAALRAARTKLEDRVLDSVVDDFVFAVVQSLEVDSLASEAVEKILYVDCRKKHQVIVKQFAHLPFCRKELQRISDETERSLKSILLPSQFREYRSLSASVDTLTG